jgi:hypothetical protein
LREQYDDEPAFGHVTGSLLSGPFRGVVVILGSVTRAAWQHLVNGGGAGLSYPVV